MLTRAKRLAPSSNPYAFLFSEVVYEDLERRDGTILSPFQAVLPAVWLGRKHGETTITYGTYTVFAESSRTEPLSRKDSLEELVSKADTRYGGTWHQKFDGDVLLMEPGHILPIAEQIERVNFLRAVLDDPENLPAGWDGWFRK